MDKVILKAEELDGYLTASDKDNLSALEALFGKAPAVFKELAAGNKSAEKKLIDIYDEIGNFIQKICRENPRIHVYSFSTSQENRPETSRIIAKIRNKDTDNNEFIYYIQRAYEMLFKFGFFNCATCEGASETQKNHLIVKTPVVKPEQNYAVHKIDNIDSQIENTVMCVLLRGALLPSMIMSKEIQGYSSAGLLTPFALFKINRNEIKKEKNMEYILDIDKSYFNLQALNGKDLIFADPMNATAGSLVTVVKFILSLGIKPHSIRIFNVISALKGSLRIIRALENSDVYTLWMDPALNEDAFIMPGLGDAGDRINGIDDTDNPRNIIRLIADYGATVANLYRSQLQEIENTVFGK